MQFPCWRYWPDGTARLVRSASEFVELPPGSRANPGMFLSADHLAYVPPVVEPDVEALEAILQDDAPAPVPATAPPPKRRPRRSGEVEARGADEAPREE